MLLSVLDGKIQVKTIPPSDIEVRTLMCIIARNKEFILFIQLFNFQFCS